MMDPNDSSKEQFFHHKN